MVEINNELTKYMDKEELIEELAKEKDKLLCRKRALLIDMGFQETSLSDLIVSDTSESAIKGSCSVVFLFNSNTVKYSVLSFVMKNENQGTDFEKAIAKIADNVVGACKEVFGFHHIEDGFLLSEHLQNGENDEKHSSDKLEYKYAGAAENGKQMYVNVLCDKEFKTAVAIAIGIMNHKWEDKHDGK